MRNLYKEPKIEVLLFDDDVETAVQVSNYKTTNAATELNAAMVQKGVKSTATLSIHSISVAGE